MSQDIESLLPDRINPVTAQENQTAVSAVRAMQEVQAMVIMAKKFPRDPQDSYMRIMKACERPSLAEIAEYAYDRGDSEIGGVTIRLAEVLIQAWGNATYGFRKISELEGVAEIEAFCWDLETNVRVTRTFSVRHVRDTRKKGKVILSDERDKYEVEANMAQRRVRACILEIIPKDIVDDARDACDRTLKTRDKDIPIEDRIRRMVLAFDKLGVSQEMIEKRLKHKLDITTGDELLSLFKIHNAIKEKASKREEWFEFPSKEASDLNDLFAQEKKPESMDAAIEEATEEMKKKKPLSAKDATFNIPGGI